MEGMQLDHVGFVTDDIEAMARTLAQVTGLPLTPVQTLEGQGLSVQFIKTDKGSLELIAPAREGSTVDKFLAKNGPGLHHVAFLVQDIHAEKTRLEGLGYRPLTPEPQPGANGKLVLFFHPADTGKLLVELCQYV